MNTYPIRSRSLPAASLLLALVAVVAIVASGCTPRGGDSGSGSPPSSPPSNTPGPTAEPTATPEPTEEPSDGIFEVDLNTPDNHDVTVTVDDATGSLSDVVSGNPGDGMSVRWFDMKVENVDPNTLRLTWVGLPLDQDVKLFVETSGDGKLRLRMVQPGPPLNSDAIGFDRIISLTFDRPVSADDVLPTIQEGLETAD